MNARTWQAAVLAVVLAAAALMFAWLGSMPLSDRDEGEYAAAVAAMARRGDYLVPTLNGRLYLEKPILIFWSVAAAQWLTGQPELGARLPSAASAFVLALLVGALVWRVAGSLVPAALALAALAFAPLNLLVARACLTDQLLSLFTTGALICGFLALEREPPADRPWWLAAWAALGLGFLTKGPVALAVVLPVAIIYALWQRRLGETLRRARLGWGLVVFLAINLPWYGLVFWRLGDVFWQAFFVSQNLRRFSEVLLGHGGGFFYYLPVLLLGCHPFVAAALPAWARALFRNPASARAADPLARLRLLAAIASAWTWLVFSLAATKQPNYVLPALPWIALLAGYFLWRLGAGEEIGPWAKRVFWGALVLGGVVWTLVLAGVPLALPLLWDQVLASIRFDSSEYALPLRPPVFVLWPLLGALAAGGGVALGWWLWRRGRAAWLGLCLAASAAALGGVLFLGLLPQAARVAQEPARRMALQVRACAGAEAAVVTYGLWKPALIFYAGRDLPRYRVEQAQELARRLAAEEPVFVFSRLRLRGRLRAVAGFQELAVYQGYLLGGNPSAARRWRACGGQKGSGP